MAKNKEKIIQQKLLYKEVQLKRFIAKYTDLLFNYEKYSKEEWYEKISCVKA